jgi:hypothetical protein
MENQPRTTSGVSVEVYAGEGNADGSRQSDELLGTADEPRLRNRIEMAKLGLFS